MNHSRSSYVRLLCLLLAITMSAMGSLHGEEVGGRWGEEREREYYPIVNIPLPEGHESSRPEPLRCFRIPANRSGNAAWRNLFD